jgi:ribosomal protein L1
MQRGKRYKSIAEKIDRQPRYELTEAVSKVREACTAKFDETILLSANLGVDPRHADQQVRGTVVLPHGTGKEVKVLVLTRGEKEKEAKEASADFVGADEFIPVGKGSFEDEKLLENVRALLQEILRAKPSSSKGRYIKSLSLSPSMGPSVRLDSQAVINSLR